MATESITTEALPARYRVVGQIGAGGMAVVLRAHDRELDRPVAIKVLAAAVAGDVELRRRFEREARLAAAVAHPNIVAVYDYGTSAGKPYIVMELVDGETLAALAARRAPVDWEAAASMLAGVCSGLEHAHAAGLVHRDISPRNLLVGRDGTVRIADFGIARSAASTRLTAVGTVLGTAAYLAPEQARGEEVGPPADVYAVGVVLYQLVTGRLPFEAATLAGLVARQRDTAPLPLRTLAPSAPARLEEVVMRCLAQLPEYRPPAAELRSELAAVAGVATAALPARPRVRRRVPLLAVAVLLAALAAGLALGLLAAHRHDASPRPRASTGVPRSPDAQARALVVWLRAHSR